MTILIAGWGWFCVGMALLLLTAALMQRYGNFFITKDVVLRNFTILDLELASSETEIDNILKGVNQLQPDEARTVIRALKNHLYLDFLFMPAAYGTIFIGCMKVAAKMPVEGAIFFTALGWLQTIAWICDLVENVYLLQKIRLIGSAEKRSLLGFRTFRVLEMLKWSLSLLAAVCILSALLYQWISGLYRIESLRYLLIVAVELSLFIFAMRLAGRSGKKWKRSVRE